MDPTPPTDEELVRRARAGDESAYQDLVDRYESLLRGQAERRVAGVMRRRLAASDLMQETWAAALGRLQDFEDHGPGSFRRWVARILENKAADAAKRHVQAARRSVLREVSRPDEAPAPEPLQGAPSPSALAAVAEERERLRAALEGASGDDRVVLSLVHDQGKSFEETGRVMGRSADAVRKLYGRAVLRLGRAMGRENERP